MILITKITFLPIGMITSEYLKQYKTKLSNLSLPYLRPDN